MKRTVFSIAALVFVFSTFLALAADDAGARRSPRHRGYHRHHHKGHHAWVVPPPGGKSSWCKKNPKKCHSRSKGDPKVNTKYENCMDVRGNGDGYICGWEKERFGGVCK